MRRERNNGTTITPTIFPILVKMVMAAIRTTDILQQLQSVMEQRVERWNKYQEILDEIGKKCNRRVADVRLARNVYIPSMAGEAENARVHGKPKRCTTGDDRQRKGSGSRARKEIRMTIERCKKCGKSFMRKSEVECHKIWEHHPVSPLEDRLAAAADNNKSEDLHRL